MRRSSWRQRQRLQIMPRRHPMTGCEDPEHQVQAKSLQSEAQSRPVRAVRSMHDAPGAPGAVLPAAGPRAIKLASTL